MLDKESVVITVMKYKLDDAISVNWWKENSWWRLQQWIIN